MRLPFKVALLGATVAAALRELLGVFGEAFEDHGHYLTRQPDDAYLGRLLGSSHFIAVVARAEGRIIGGLAANVLPKFEQARFEFYICDLAVEAAARRQGVVSALIAELQHLAAERGAYVIYMQADQGDEPAIALHSKLGVREEVLHFDIAPAPRSF